MGKRGPKKGTKWPEAGRPKKKIDWKQFEFCCKAQCTLEEIAGFFDCSVDTIENHVKEEFGETFSEVYKKKSIGGKASLRRAQYKAALSGNVTAQIWLGKNQLGQRDKTELTGVDGGPIKQEVVVERKPVTLEEVEDLARQTVAAAERARERAKRSAGGS